VPIHQPDFGQLLTAIRRGEPERLPFYEHLADAQIVEAITGEPVTRIDGSTREGKEAWIKGQIDFYLQLGFDCLSFEVGPRFPRENVLKAADTAPLPRGERGWVDEHAGPIQTMDDVEAYPWPDFDQAVDYEAFEIARRLLPEGMLIVGGCAGGIFEHASWLMGVERLSLAIYDDPALVTALLDRITATICEADRRLLQIGGIGALRMGDDLGFKTGPFLSPASLREHIFPRQKQVADVAHQAGLPFVLHSCGNATRIMDDLIDVVGVDAKHSFEDVIMPVAEVKRRWGDRVALLGGADVDYLARHSEDEVRGYTRRLIEACAPGGGWALGTGNSVANYIPVGNYLAMLEEGRRARGDV
jgi:uroporphyrinogen decarboxylase